MQPTVARSLSASQSSVRPLQQQLLVADDDHWLRRQRCERHRVWSKRVEVANSTRNVTLLSFKNASFVTKSD
jgi:hypothetical protein